VLVAKVSSFPHPRAPATQVIIKPFQQRGGNLQEEEEVAYILQQHYSEYPSELPSSWRNPQPIRQYGNRTCPSHCL
jgi:hypothetical protein